MQKQHIFTGVGARTIPSNIFKILYDIGVNLMADDWICRTGTADGSDMAFRESYMDRPLHLEVYAPGDILNNKFGNADLAKSIVKNYHPYYDRIQCAFSQALLARNIYQVLGSDLNTPSEIVFCYTDNGLIQGGSAIAIRIAQHYGIPIVNLGNPKHLKAILDYLKRGVFIERLNNKFN